MLPTADNLTIAFAHVSYPLAERFAARETGINHFQTWDRESTLDRIAEAHVAVMSGFWGADMLDRAEQLRFIQVPAAGYDQFDLDALRQRGIRLTNGRGVMANAVAEHAMALILSFTRHLHVARDNQRRSHWRGMLSDAGAREEELGGKTMVVYGLGTIGSRLAKLARAFDVHVIGIKRDIEHHDGSANDVKPPEQFIAAIADADIVALTCPLTDATRGLIDAAALAAMPSRCFLVNVARGGCVDEAALIDALERGEIAGAGIDTTAVEPLPEDSRLWSFDNVILTPHSGGETRHYENNVVDLLLENLNRMWDGRTDLKNEIV